MRNLSMLMSEILMSCSQCDKKFSWAFSLKEHEKTHTNEKPFSCSLCIKKFATLSNMKIHKKTHRSAKGVKIPTVSSFLQEIKTEPS